MNRNRGILLMLCCSVLWSTAGVLFKYLPWSAFAIAGLRALISAMTVLTYILCTKQRVIVDRNTLFGGLSKGLLCLCFVIANKLTTAANAIVLQFTAPIFLLILSALFLHKRFRRADYIAVALTFCGIALFFFDQMDAGKLRGNLFGVAAGFFMSIMYLFVDRCTSEERFSSLLIGELVVVLVSFPLFVREELVFNTLTVSVILFLGIFQLGVPYILYALAASSCPPLVCSLLAAVEPLLNPVWVALFYKELPGSFALAGGAVVILTITLWCMWSDRHPAETAA